MKRVVFIAVLMAALFGLVRCALSIDQLEPYPCAADHSCPGGLACVPGVGCTHATLDAFCGAGTDCSKAATGASCTSYGICAQSCTQPGSSCGAGRVCSSDRVCVLDCSADAGVCPSQFNCRDLHADGGLGCVPSSVPIATCTSASINISETCGSSSVQTVTCPDSKTCPTNSVCVPAQSGSGYNCYCYDAYVPVSCSGTLCSNVSGGCTGGTYICAPFDQASVCGQNGFGRSTYSCSDGRFAPTWCGGSQSACEGFCAIDTGCDLVQQNCAAGSKCTRIGSASRCVPLSGDAGVDQPCTSGAQGDDCATGLYCAPRSAADGGPLCRSFCNDDSVCRGVDRCNWYASGTPPVGLCLPACQFFDGTCPAGSSCSENFSIQYTVLGHCRPNGATAPGATCRVDADCVADATCIGGTCYRDCDTSHACDAGTCAPMYGAAPSYGGSLGYGSGYCH